MQVNQAALLRGPNVILLTIKFLVLDEFWLPNRTLTQVFR